MQYLTNTTISSASPYMPQMKMICQTFGHQKFRSASLQRVMYPAANDGKRVEDFPSSQTTVKKKRKNERRSRKLRKREK